MGASPGKSSSGLVAQAFKQAALEADGAISKSGALALASVNVEKLLGGKVDPDAEREFVATEGGDLFDMKSKVRAVISPRQGFVHLL